MRTLTKEQEKALIKQSHALHPVVIIGNKGLTEGVALEIERALDAHELIKIKIAGSDRETRQRLFEQIANTHDATLVHSIGFIGTFYRPNSTKK